MKLNSCTASQGGETGFDLFRLSKSKEIVDVCSNTIRSYFKQGLPSYRRGKAVFGFQSGTGRVHHERRCCVKPSKSFFAYLKRQDKVLAQAKLDADRAMADHRKLMRSLPPASGKRWRNFTGRLPMSCEQENVNLGRSERPADERKPLCRKPTFGGMVRPACPPGNIPRKNSPGDEAP